MAEIKNMQGHFLQAPWLEKPFQHLYGKVKVFTLVSPDRCYLLQKLIRNCIHFDGEVIECGCFKGGTAYLLANEIKNTDKSIYLFDTFEGMPDIVVPERDHSYKGQFGDTSLDLVMKLLRPFRNKVNIYKGLIPETFKWTNIDKLCFAHIDVDIYPSTFDSIKFIYPKMVSGGIIICDDYGFKVYEKAAKQAIDDYFKDKEEEVICLPTGQAMIIKI